MPTRESAKRKDEPMPITQDRFIAVIDTADALVESYGTIYRLIRDNTDVTSNANSVLTYCEDKNACATIRELLGMFNVVNAVINETINGNLDGIGKVKGEKQYFTRMRKVNDRQANYAKQKRYTEQSIRGKTPMQGRIIPEFAPLAPIDIFAAPASASPALESNPRPRPAFENTPEYKAFQKAMQEKYEREKDEFVQHPIADGNGGFVNMTRGEANAALGLIRTVDAEGTVRWLPPSQVLNAPPTSSDEDLI